MFRRNIHDVSRYNCRININISDYSKLVEYIPPDLSKGKFLIIYTMHQNRNHQHPSFPLGKKMTEPGNFYVQENM